MLCHSADFFGQFQGVILKDLWIDLNGKMQEMFLGKRYAATKKNFFLNNDVCQIH